MIVSAFLERKVIKRKQAVAGYTLLLPTSRFQVLAVFYVGLYPEGPLGSVQ
jgi:hypothetical protein